MTQRASTTTNHARDALPGEDLSDFVTFVIADQMFGVPVQQVQEILSPANIATIPLAPSEFRGSINLRGRIVTAIDVRVRLGLGNRPDDAGMGVTVEHDHALYALLVDRVGDVIGLSPETYESNPATMSAMWREFAAGVYRLDGKLMVVLNVERLLNVKT